MPAQYVFIVVTRNYMCCTMRTSIVFDAHHMTPLGLWLLCNICVGKRSFTIAIYNQTHKCSLYSLRTYMRIQYVPLICCVY